jgi:hypothetical protein
VRDSRANRLTLAEVDSTPRSRFHPTPLDTGNWDEDITRIEVASRDFELRRSKGELLHLRKAREAAFLAQAAPHTYSPDGLLRFGDKVMLGTGADREVSYLSNHIFTMLAPGHSRVTAGPARSGAQARNIWTLCKVGGGWSRAPGVPVDAILRYGDRVRLECDAALIADADTKLCGLPMSLHSSRGNNLLGTSRKGKQEVSMCVAGEGAPEAEFEWLVTCASGDRLVTDGAPIKVGAPVSLLHVMSNVALATRSGDVYPSEFGAELDVHCCSVRATGQASANHAGALQPTPALPPNIWRFVTAADASAGVDDRGFIPLSPSSLLIRARTAIAAAAGMHGFRSLSLVLSNLDPRNSGLVPIAGLTSGLAAHGVSFSASEFSLLLDPFRVVQKGLGGSAAASSGGYASRSDFIAALRGGDMTASVLAAVEEAFAVVSASGAPTIGALKARYDGKSDPRSRSGAMTHVECKAEFARQWPSLKHNSDVVTAKDFVDYYTDVAGALDNDSILDVIANAWHVPGKGAWLVKKDKRVLVTFHKGSSTEALIPGGEVIPDDDFAGLEAALAKMKFGGIARIKVLGLVEPKE